MQPRFFKKDSRTWLHKNSHAKINCSPRPIDLVHECSIHDYETDESLDLQSDKALYNNPYPIITHANGRVFKKDSRTWLHKSSAIKTQTPGVNDVICRASYGNKPKRFVRGSKPQPPQQARQTPDDTDVIRLSTTVSTTEIVRGTVSRRHDPDGQRDMDVGNEDSYPPPSIHRLNSDSHLDLSTIGRKCDHLTRASADPRMMDKVGRFCSTDLYDDDIEEECDEIDSDRADDDDYVDENNDTDSNDENDVVDGCGREWPRLQDDHSRHGHWNGMEWEATRQPRSALEIAHKEKEPPFGRAKTYRSLKENDLSHDINDVMGLCCVKPISLDTDDNEGFSTARTDAQSPRADYQLSVATEYLHVTSPCQRSVFDSRNV